jgi:hypothetical protein
LCFERKFLLTAGLRDARRLKPALLVVLSIFVVGAVCANGAQPVDLTGKPADPFASPAAAQVLLFVRTDCPITNRYAPELQRLSREFHGRNVRFWMIYPDATETAVSIQNHIRQYSFPGTPLRDPGHELVKRAHVTIAPEAAVFDSSGSLKYHGRIDDRYIDVGTARPAAQTHDLEDAISAVLAGKSVTHAETQAVGCWLADIE